MYETAFSFFFAAHYDQLAAQYDSFYWYTREAFSELAVKRLGIVPSDRVADVGGGTGAVSELIARKVGEAGNDHKDQ